MTWIDLSSGTDGYRFTTSRDSWVSVGSIFQSFGSCTNDVEFWILLLLLFSFGWIIWTRYLDIPYVGVPMIDKIVLVGQFFSGLCAFIVQYNRGGVGSDGYIPPRLYGAIKAHKPDKNFPMRPIASTTGTPAYGISKYLVQIIQPRLNKSNNKTQSSTSLYTNQNTGKWSQLKLKYLTML